MKKIFINILLATVAFVLQSCLHDNQDFFGASPAERLDKAVAEDKALLESATNGWLLQFYTGKEYSKAGYNFLLKFKDGKAYVSAEIAPSGMVSESKYDVTQERGPVLTFPTHNVIMHHLAQAYQSNVDGLQGDYEFVIMKTTQDSIYLRGKKWGNDMVMTRMPSDMQWKTYLDSISTIKENLFSNYRVVINNTDTIGTVELDPDNGRVAFTGKNGSFADDEKPFCYTLSGIVMPTSVDLKGQKATAFTWDAANNALVSGNIKLVGVLSDSYQPKTFWGGNWTVNYNSTKSFPLKLTQAGGNNFNGEFTIDGKTYKAVFKYNTGKGSLSLVKQEIDDPSNTYPKLMWLGASMPASQVALSEGTGFDIIWDKTTNKAMFIDNGKAPTVSVNSFALIALDANGQYVTRDNGSVVAVEIVSNITSMTK